MLFATTRSAVRDMQLCIRCRHHLKVFQHALKHMAMIYTSTKFGKREIIGPKSPATRFGIMAGVFLRHKARELGFRVLPDGFVRVSEILNHSDHFKRFNFNEFQRLVKNDPMHRFEMTFRNDLMINGNLEKVWWVRAKYGHTIPGVNAGNREIIHVGKLGTVYYVTHASNWEHIREHGIPQGPDHLIQLFNISIYNNLFFDHVPVHAKALRISIDPKKAVTTGVKFFHTKHAQLIASGDLDHTIPLTALKSVTELEFNTTTETND